MKRQALSVLVGWLLVQGVLLAQGHKPTLRERVIRAQDDVVIGVTGCGPRISLDDVVAASDLIVRGTIGGIRSSLTDDGYQIYTEHQILSPQFFHGGSHLDQVLPTAPRPGWPVSPPPLSFRSWGGQVRVEGFTATMHSNLGVTLKPGAEVILLLDDRDGVYWPVVGIGAFEVTEGRLVPLGDPGYSRQFEDLDADDFLSDIVRGKVAMSR